MIITVIRNGKPDTYKINYFEISNYNEGYISLHLKGVLAPIISIDIKDIQEVNIREDKENDSTGT